MVKFGARTKKWRLNLCRNRYVINAPISRVLPTLVANAKQRDGKSRSGARRLRRFAIAFTSEFIGYGSPRQPPRITAWSRPCSSFVHWWERPRRAQGIGALPADF